MAADLWTVRSWRLAHHAGILTYPHHDAEGAGTFVIPYSGTKIWLCIKVNSQKVPRDELSNLCAEISSPDEPLSRLGDAIRVETVHANTGDLV